MDNTTTYNTVIDVEVTGQEQVNELGDSIEQSDDKFKSLRAQIRETTVALQKLADEGKDGTKEFEALRKKLDELNDAQEKVGFQAGQFDDQLASLPGPLGAAGGAIKTFNEGLNRFSTGFKVAFGVVTLIVGAFLALKESLSRTEEGQAKLNKISEAFEKIMNAVFAVLEPIARALADLVIGLLESETVMNVLSKTVAVLSGVFTGLFGTLKAVGGFIIGTLVNNFKTLIGVAKGAGDVIAGVFTFDWERIKKGADAAFTAVKDGITNTVDNVKEMGKGIATSVTDGFNSAEKSFKDGSKRMTAAEKEAAEKAIKEAADKKAKDAAKDGAKKADVAKRNEYDDMCCSGNVAQSSQNMPISQRLSGTRVS
jgi:phage-related protein